MTEEPSSKLDGLRRLSASQLNVLSTAISAEMKRRIEADDPQTTKKPSEMTDREFRGWAEKLLKD